MQVHPSQISPGRVSTCFPADPNDTNTYYVQATIYDGRTGAILSTVQLSRSTYNL
jgi:hypothetical protein